MTIQWTEATVRRPAYFADVAGRRLHVEQTLRSHCAHGIVGNEFQACVDGVRLGEFETLEDAQAAAVHAAETKTASQDDPRGRGFGYDYREYASPYSLGTSNNV